MKAEELAERLDSLLAKATPGPWELQDGCSWRRIGTQDGNGDVLCPTNSRTDNHPDLTAGRGHDLYANLNLIVAAVNALPELLATNRELAAEVERLQNMVAAQNGVFDGMEAYLSDRHYNDPGSYTAEMAIRVFRSSRANLARDAEQMGAARWADSRRQREAIERAEAALSTVLLQRDAALEQVEALNEENARLKAAAKAVVPLVEIGANAERARFEAMHRPQDYSITAGIGIDRLNAVVVAFYSALNPDKGSI